MRVGVEHIGAVALNVGCAAGHLLAQVVLGDDFDGEMVFEHGDAGLVAHGFNESALYFEARVVGMVQNAELAVSALAVKVVAAVVASVELHAPAHEPLNALGGTFHHLAHGCGVAYPVAGHHGVLDMLVEVVDLEVSYRGHSALSLGGIGLFNRRFAHQCHSALA